MHPVDVILMLEEEFRAFQPGFAQNGFHVRFVVIAFKEDEAVRLFIQRLQCGRYALRVVRIQHVNALKRREFQRVLRHIVGAEQDARQRGVLFAGGDIGAVTRIEIMHLLIAVHARAAGRQHRTGQQARRTAARTKPATAARKEHEQRNRHQRIDAEDVSIHLIRRNNRDHQHIRAAGQKRPEGKRRAAFQPLPRFFERPKGQRRANQHQRQ